ncbi:uncharacterized protein BDV14DRAFT_177132 [Aspergillus stella-maris]|uniref:uncharacterized protein n=1 Tax=Aspergillus stella-maris TaxID=1810926 RepID=UPI003CCD13A3
MTFSGYCKSIACAIVPWCGRGKRHVIDEYSEDYPKKVPPAPAYNGSSRSRQEKYQSFHHNHNNNYNCGQCAYAQEAPPPIHTIYTPNNYGGTITAFDFGDSRFIYDTEIYSSPLALESEVEHTNEKLIYRRLILDFDDQKTTDAICDEIPQALNIPIKPYKGSEVQLPNGDWEMPVGTAEIPWKVYEGQRVYRTHFLVMKDSQFDMLLSRATIKRYKFWEEDKDVKGRLNGTMGSGRR